MQKCPPEERNNLDLTTKMDNDASATRKGQDGKLKGDNMTTTISGGGAQSKVVNLAPIPETNSSDLLLRQSKAQQSGRRISIRPVPVESARILQGPACLSRSVVEQGPRQPAGVPHHQRIVRGGNEKVSSEKPHSFKIYTREVSLESRPKAAATSISPKPTDKSNATLTNATYVPKNAASGLAKTTKAFGECAKRSAPSRTIPPSSETSKKPCAVRQTDEHRDAIARTGSSIEANSASTHGREPYTNAKRQSTAEIPTSDYVGKNLQGEIKLRNAMTPLLDPKNGQGPTGDGCVEQRRTLRGRITMIFTSRPVQGENDVRLLEEPVVKSAVSRRKSVLQMFK